MPTEIVVVAKDDAVVRLLAVEIFEDMGFRVVEAENADRALKEMEAHPEVFLVFTDIEMPPGSMNGLEMARQIRTTRPQTNIIVTSGRVAPVRFELPSYGVFIQKPYRAEQLSFVVADMKRKRAYPAILGFRSRGGWRNLFFGLHRSL